MSDFCKKKVFADIFFKTRASFFNLDPTHEKSQPTCAAATRPHSLSGLGRGGSSLDIRDFTVLQKKKKKKSAADIKFELFVGRASCGKKQAKTRKTTAPRERTVIVGVRHDVHIHHTNNETN